MLTFFMFISLVTDSAFKSYIWSVSATFVLLTPSSSIWAPVLKYTWITSNWFNLKRHHIVAPCSLQPHRSSPFTECSFSSCDLAEWIRPGFLEGKSPFISPPVCDIRTVHGHSISPSNPTFPHPPPPTPFLSLAGKEDAGGAWKRDHTICLLPISLLSARNKHQINTHTQ